MGQFWLFYFVYYGFALKKKRSVWSLREYLWIEEASTCVSVGEALGQAPHFPEAGASTVLFNVFTSIDEYA